MKQIKSKAFTLVLTLVLIFNMAVPALAADKIDLKSEVEKTAAYMLKAVPSPQVGSVGGEWAVLGLARSGYKVPDAYYQKYYDVVEAYVKAEKGVLHDKKYTEYSRVILGLTAAGFDPTDVAGYNLTTALGDFDRTVWQGINGPIFALISLDTGNYVIPKNASATVQATRDKYVDEILSRQLGDGGFSLFGGSDIATASEEVADPDITGMALQALAKYQHRADVKKVVGEALDCLSKMQKKDGGFASWGTDNLESTAQVIVALTELGIPLEDPRFVKNGRTLLEDLMKYRQADGSFRHTLSGEGNNQMSTEQGFYAMVAAQRAEEGKTSLYRMSDAVKRGAVPEAGTKMPGLPGKNPDVKQIPVSAEGKTFGDVISHKNKAAIESLASRGIVGGMGDGHFAPDKTMTRAEFAVIIVGSLGLTPKNTNDFIDVSAGAWYAGYVGTAGTYGIVSGVGDSKYNPGGTITRQEAAAMVARAAKLCGMNTAMDDNAVREMLAQFTDYVKVDAWAKESMAFSYDNDILNQTDIEILPKAAIKRGEMAQMLFNMLTKAELL